MRSRMSWACTEKFPRREVGCRTLVRAVESGKLSGRMSDAFERALQSGAGPAVAGERERNDALERRR